ncbi:MAG: Periplasmic thiol:disulfide interchange protein DsbA [Candidatus Nomurabacteria bacterium GW2011_GWB1_37_5]|uniref:Periplasmic thiol:disulfide interchange protein DsbA n=1 Tax=Candidatus Nomurabacteria bacterium GW2011_GWB1_37_5 TaxID=1618742 RepID=A0A0G0GXB9_9BACT|nr:MAG: Periplasmic thiol:disulfide interchange protein DsbA [Candidatus Nomurabacteria bacterium GW2011_GWB1_37_5]
MEEHNIHHGEHHTTHSDVHTAAKPSRFTLSLPSAIVIAGVLIAGAILIKSPNSANSAPNLAQNGQVPTAPQDIKLREVSNIDHVRGDLKTAKVVIVEYSDFECPFCQRFHSTMNQVMKEYSGKVAWVYRHFPLEFHTKSPKESEASECAASLGGNDAFWKFADRIFEISPTNNGLDPAELPKIAEFVGLDVQAFKKCLESGQFAERVASDLKEGAAAGVQGTPHSIIMTANGKKKIPLSGAQPIESVKQVIDSLL